MMTVEPEFRQVLAEMTLLSYGRTQSFDSSGGKSENPDPRPHGESKPFHEYWAHRWTLEPVSGRSALLADAREALRCWKVRTAPVEDDGSNEDDWIIRDGEGFSADQVARKFNVTTTRVRRVRVRNDRDAEYGKEVQALVPSASKDERVVLLTERGLSSREVAAQVDLHKTQVLRILARHRTAA
jgi:hypothetical protein